jgi:hypothetical protein
MYAEVVTIRLEGYICFRHFRLITKGVAMPKIPEIHPLVLPTNEWQRNVEWSINDSGRCEEPIQKEWARLDQLYHTDLVLYCLGTGGEGRRTAMQIAIDCAKHKFDQKALDITVSTQMHNSPAAQTIVKAGAWPVAQYLRGK